MINYDFHHIFITFTDYSLLPNLIHLLLILVISLVLVLIYLVIIVILSLLFMTNYFMVIQYPKFLVLIL